MNIDNIREERAKWLEWKNIVPMRDALKKIQTINTDNLDISFADWVTVGDKSNITEYIFSLIRKLIQHIVIHREYDVQIPNELLIYSKGMSFETLKQSIHSRSEREHLMSEGRRYASVYLIYKQKSLN